MDRKGDNIIVTYKYFKYFLSLIVFMLGIIFLTVALKRPSAHDLALLYSVGVVATIGSAALFYCVRKDWL